MLVDQAFGQKGGAKGAMRNRGRGGAGGSRRGGANRGDEDDGEDSNNIQWV